MSAAKDLLLKNKELSEQWRAVAHSSWFRTVLIHARADFTEAKLTESQLEGGKAFELALLALADEEVETVAVPTPGLVHTLDIRRKTLNTKKE